MTDLVHGTHETFIEHGCCCVYCRDAVRIHCDASKPLGAGIQRTTGRVPTERVNKEAARALRRLLDDRSDLDLDLIRISRADFADGKSRITISAHLPAGPQVSDEEGDRK